MKKETKKEKKEKKKKNMASSDVLSATLTCDRRARDAAISQFLDRTESDEDVFAGIVVLMGQALESRDAETMAVAAEVVQAVGVLRQSMKPPDGNHLSIRELDLVFVAGLAKDVFTAIGDAASSDAEVRTAVVPLQRFIDDNSGTFDPAFFAAMVSVLQEGYMACYRRHAPDMGKLRDAIAGCRAGAAHRTLRELAPVHAAHLAREVEVAWSEYENLRKRVPEVEASVNAATRRHDSAAMLQGIADLAPVAELMEPHLVTLVAGAIGARDVALVKAASELAQRHSLLRLPIREAHPPPLPNMEPFEFRDGQPVMRDPDDFFEHAGYLGGLHPSELEGEFTSIAFADVWLDFEKEHGDASEASTRYVPLAWLAVKLFEAASGSCDDSQESKSLCCQAVQLLDPDGNVDVCWPRGCVRQLETLRLPLFELATESEQQVLGTAAGSDVEEQAPEADGGGLRVHIIEYSRHPQSLRSALLSCESLLPCQRGLRDAGFSPELPSGAKIFVPAEFYEAVVMAVENVEDLRLTPGHVIVSEEFEEAALAAVASLRSREQVEGNATSPSSAFLPASSAVRRSRVSNAPGATSLAIAREVARPCIGRSTSRAATLTGGDPVGRQQHFHSRGPPIVPSVGSVVMSEDGLHKCCKPTRTAQPAEGIARGSAQATERVAR
eukprot:CAMPEP_0198577976 /NCGR_PEP_ID=MMETSP1462-20131121/119608_1 /TAXON_ID=1333877 /ORGANISM="Brandtodinium nutriculum, Strain RCC3387" /LENGTH=667 /DNA_ID=CAMNT_0044309263 /DNA_START=42 /DNA_END=2047 /DNA_ORIENTATION=+